MQSPDVIRERVAEVQERVGDEVTIVAATKYVALHDMAALLEAGVTVVGENRAQDLEAKHAEYGDAFRWHFIGHLQSNKVKVVNRICELVQVNLAGEGSKSGVDPAEISAYLRYDVRGLSTMPPAATTPEESRQWFARLRELAAENGLRELSMGTTQDYAIAPSSAAIASVRSCSATRDAPGNVRQLPGPRPRGALPRPRSRS